MKNFLLSLVLISTCSCAVVVPNTKVCAVAGVLQAGAVCTETLTGVESEMTFEEFVAWVEPDVTPGQERGPAVLMSSKDYAEAQTALEQACRVLGARCTPAVKKTIRTVKRNVDKLRQRSSGLKAAQ